MASKKTDLIIHRIESLGPNFNPLLVVDFLRLGSASLNTDETNLIADLIEGMWDEMCHLRGDLQVGY